MEPLTNLPTVQEANPLLKKSGIVLMRRKGDELHAAVKARYALYWKQMTSDKASDPLTVKAASYHTRTYIQLHHLPVEILIEISHYLRHYELNALITSSRTLHTLLNHVLYRTYPINSFFSNNPSVTSAPSPLPPFVTRLNMVTSTPIDITLNAFPHLIEVRIDDFSGQEEYRAEKKEPLPPPPPTQRRSPERDQSIEALPVETVDILTLPATPTDVFPYTAPDWDRILADNAIRAVEITTRFSDTLCQLRSLTITVLSGIAFETLLGRCSALQHIELCPAKVAISPVLDNLMGAMARTVGKTLRTLCIHEPPDYARPADMGVFFRSIGQPNLFPVFKAIWFRPLFVSYDRFGAMARYQLLMDLYKAQVTAATSGGVSWGFNQEYETSTPFTLSMMDVACFRSREQLHAMLDWLAVQCPLWGADRCIRLLGEDDMLYFAVSKVPIYIIALLGDDYPVSFAYNSSNPLSDYDTHWVAPIPRASVRRVLMRNANTVDMQDGGVGHDAADEYDADGDDDNDDDDEDDDWEDTPAAQLHTLHLTIAELDPETIDEAINEIFPVRRARPALHERLARVNAHFTKMWADFLGEFHPALVQLKRLVVGPRCPRSSPFGGFFCPEALGDAVGILVCDYGLADLDVDMSGIWHRDVPGGWAIPRAPAVGYSDLVYRMHWLADELAMENLKKLTLRKVFITKWGDREWFYSLPRRLGRLQEFTVVGLVWDVEELGLEALQQEKKAKRKKFKIDARKRFPRGKILFADFDLDRFELEPEFDSLVDTDCSEIINHGLRKTRVAERITRNVVKVALSVNPGREFRFRVADIRLFTGRGFGDPSWFASTHEGQCQDEGEDEDGDDNDDGDSEEEAEEQEENKNKVDENSECECEDKGKKADKSGEQEDESDESEEGEDDNKVEVGNRLGDLGLGDGGKEDEIEGEDESNDEDDEDDEDEIGWGNGYIEDNESYDDDEIGLGDDFMASEQSEDDKIDDNDDIVGQDAQDRLWLREELGFEDLDQAEDTFYDESPEARASRIWI